MYCRRFLCYRNLRGVIWLNPTWLILWCGQDDEDENGVIVVNACSIQMPAVGGGAFSCCVDAAVCMVARESDSDSKSQSIELNFRKSEG